MECDQGNLDMTSKQSIISFYCVLTDARAVGVVVVEEATNIFMLL